MAINFNLSVDKDNIEEALEVAPEKLSNEELLELGQEYIAKEEVRQKETTRVEKEEPPRKFIGKGLTEAFADLNGLLKIFENMDSNTKRVSLIHRTVHGELSVYKQIYDGKQ